MKLGRDEREVVITATDDRDAWEISCDSSRFAGRLKRVARAWGIEPVPYGEGFAFKLPLRAISFRSPKKPPTERQIAAGRALASKSRPSGQAVSS